ncbi:MAG: BON domain-containing protein [Pseudomonadota bacterium]|nr:BON domain-containing protein [Pseudomonadota bacterium]
MNRRLFAAAILGATACLGLSGCFPLVATGMVTGTLVAVDRRTSGIVVEDNASELRIGNRISTRFGADAHVNVHSFNRIVLLTGEVHSDDIRKGVEEIAQAAENVRSVVNEVTVGPISSVSNRIGDSLLADKIRARFIGDGSFPANIVATIVERHEVFLMGMVTPQEADDIVKIASTTDGVERVVKVFEYVDPAAIKSPAAPPKQPAS